MKGKGYKTIDTHQSNHMFKNRPEKSWIISEW